NIDFSGRKQLIIPCGEAAWTNAHWGWRFGTKHFNYSDALTTVRMGFGYIPSNTVAHLEILGVSLLDNVDAVVESPEIHINEGKLQIKGDLNPGEYFTYRGGEAGAVFDNNWNFLRKVEVENMHFIANQGVV